MQEQAPSPSRRTQSRAVRPLSPVAVGPRRLRGGALILTWIKRALAEGNILVREGRWMVQAMKNPLNMNFDKLRADMVEKAIFARGVARSLFSMPCAMCLVNPFFRHNFASLPTKMFLCRSRKDRLSRSLNIVAFMTEALALRGGEKVLEIGTGSGYAAAVLSEIAADVYTVERHLAPLAEKAAATLADLGYDNVHVLHADGTRGWSEHAPFDAIVVAAGGPVVPEILKGQLRIGGRMVIPVGTDRRAQELVRVTRIAQSEYRREDLADVQFVPLLGQEGWAPEEAEPTHIRRAAQAITAGEEMLVKRIAGAAEPFVLDHTADFGPLLERVGSARIVLLGEATHGTSEFYRMRERISRELII